MTDAFPTVEDASEATSPRITPACHDILRVLKDAGPLIPKTIAERTGRAPLTVYRALRILRTRGFVVKREMPQGSSGRPSNEWRLKRPDEPLPDEWLE